MEETIELPKGYLLMDTVCLLNYIQGKSPDKFDYKQVEEYVHDKGWWIVITPNTLYESIQRCTDIEFIGVMDKINGFLEDLFANGQN
jgi:hypothetical protein